MLLSGEKFGYINFFDERLIGFDAMELDKVVQAFYELYGNTDYFIFDEIQKVIGWERFISRLRTANRIIITGSNSDLLRGNLATYITGRHLDIELLPFGFREYLRAAGIDLDKGWQYSTTKVASVKRALVEFVEKGGFPEVSKFGSIMLQAIFKDIIENDVIGQHKVRGSQSLRELAKYLMSNIGKEVTFNKLRNAVAIKNAHTIAKYAGYISDSYLVFLVERFSYKLKEQFKAPKKVYCVDTGLSNSVSFRISKDLGRLMENVVFVELLRRTLYSGSNEELYFWKDYTNHEVDFVRKEGSKVVQLVQVAYASKRLDMDEREIVSLINASKDLRCSDLSVITWDYRGTSSVRGKRISFVPLWSWLTGSA
jgi:predicted AAA+ superfamily ATPase